MEKQESRRSRLSPARLAGGWLFVVAFLGIATFSRAGDDVSKSSPGDDTSGKPAFIDQLIEEGWQKAGVKPAKPAADDEFMRRAYLDLLGRIPNIQECRSFLQTREKG